MPTAEKKFVLSQVFENVSTLTEEKVFSPEVQHFNVPWDFGVYRNNDMFTIYLFCKKPRSLVPWSVKVKCEMRLLPTTGKSVVKHTSYTFANDSEFSAFGFNLIGWNNLIKDYLVNDKLVVEVHVIIEELKGVEKPKKLTNFDETTKELSDVVLKVGEEKFYVLKKHLARQSPFFKSLLFDKLESSDSEVTLKDVDPEYFQNFLELLNLDESLTDSNVEGVLELVDKFKTVNGVRVCEKFLIHYSKHTLRTKLRIAARYKLEKLKNHCFDNIKSSADVRSVVGPDLAQLDPLITNQLVEKALLFCV